MQSFPPSLIIRHRKERLKKCSLFGLESCSDLLFFSYPNRWELPIIDRAFLLSLEGEPLSEKECGEQLILLDGTWKYAEKMRAAFLEKYPVKERTLPVSWKTAYPRRQQDCADQSRGLASVEALYAAYVALGRPSEHLLERYHWKKDFLSINGCV